MKKFVSVLLCGMLLLGCLCLSGCEAEQGNVVNVYNWGEYIDESIFEDFEAETGITVNYKTFSSNELNFHNQLSQ